MDDSGVPDFFERFPMSAVSDATLDAALAEATTPIDILFLWGRDCPNCDIAKRSILANPRRFQWPQVRWLHDNVYADPTMATRFGLHGIPAFLVFSRGRRLGKISPFPGPEPFVAAIERQIAQAASSE